MIVALEVYGLVFGLGLPLCVLLWPYLPVIAIKGAAVITIAFITGCVAFLTSSFAWGFISEFCRQQKR